MERRWLRTGCRNDGIRTPGRRGTGQHITGSRRCKNFFLSFSTSPFKDLPCGYCFLFLPPANELSGTSRKHLKWNPLPQQLLNAILDLADLFIGIKARMPGDELPRGSGVAVRVDERKPSVGSSSGRSGSQPGRPPRQILATVVVSCSINRRISRSGLPVHTCPAARLGTCCPRPKPLESAAQTTRHSNS